MPSACEDDLTMVLGMMAAVVCCWLAALGWNLRQVRGCHAGGNPVEGIVVFVEPVRWLFIVWGFAAFCRGLRRAGGLQAVHLFRWSGIAGALLVIPDLVRRRKLDRHAQRLTRVLEQLSDQHPGTKIHVVGYSSGAYIACEACKKLSDSASIASVILLAPSASPTYDWGRLADCSGLRVHTFYSPLDMINIIGPLLFGGNDRKWMPAAGAVGFKYAPDILTQRRWRPSDMQLGYYGDHFTIASSRFVARHVAPIILGRC